MRLSKAGQEALARALIDPPEPNAALKRAFKRRKELIKR
ncbi:type II toxin -antitoxin system TacA 1-like antitoxin [Achromobacter aegrifaciens]